MKSPGLNNSLAVKLVNEQTESESGCTINAGTVGFVLRNEIILPCLTMSGAAVELGLKALLPEVESPHREKGLKILVGDVEEPKSPFVLKIESTPEADPIKPRYSFRVVLPMTEAPSKVSHVMLYLPPSDAV